MIASAALDQKNKGGKGKGKGKDSGSKGKGKGKDKGKFGGEGNVSQNWNHSWNNRISKVPRGGKGKGKDFSKGKSSGGKSKGQSQTKLDPNQCSYFLNFGHRKLQCRKHQADKGSGNVRQINDDSCGGCSTAAEISISTAPTSSSSNAAQNVRKISSVTPYLQDLTLGED